MQNMRNKLIALFLILVFALCAGAAQVEFNGFAVEVPDGWTAQERGTTVVIRANDDSAVVSVTLDTIEGATLKEIAEAFAGELGGSKPQFDGGVYRFNFQNEQGVDSVMLISGEGNKFTAVSITGDHPEVGIIVDSLTAK